jgi:hypothetical protein
MPPSVRFVVAIFAFACHGALAQTAISPVLTVQRLAPQLVPFAGSQLNFQNLVNGLAQGTAVQLVTTLPDGFTQIVTFTPTVTLAPADIAVRLEAARQQLIGLGIATPTAEQLGFTLMGGVVPTALGGTQVAGVLNPQNPPSVAAQMQAAGAGGSVATSNVPVAPLTGAVNVQLFPSTQPATPTTTAVLPRNTSDSLTPAGATSFSPPVSTSTSPVQSPLTRPLPGDSAANQQRAAERVRPGAPPARN